MPKAGALKLITNKFFISFVNYIKERVILRYELAGTLIYNNTREYFISLGLG